MKIFTIVLIIICSIILVGAFIGLTGATSAYFGYKEITKDKNGDDKEKTDNDMEAAPYVSQEIPEEVIERPYADDEATQATEQDNVVVPTQEQTTTTAPVTLPPEPEAVPQQPKTQPQQIATTQDMPTQSNVWVAEHNRIRAAVGQPPVTWNQGMADSAKNYALNCEFKHSDKSQRTLNGTILGENLAYGSPFENYDDKKIMGLWESEKQYYDHPQYPSASSKGETGHYTQIVNKNVKQIGCGCANCDGKKICVCRYDPIQMGNQYPY